MIEREHMISRHHYSIVTIHSLSDRDIQVLHDKIHEDVKVGRARLTDPHDHNE